MRLAIVLYNLGGPDRPSAVAPFLFNLFNDGAIIGLPQPLRAMLASFIAKRRAPAAREIYARIGGRSPILEETEAQAKALRSVLQGAFASEVDWAVFVAMRYWHPRIADVARQVKSFGAGRVALLPLYPQFSTTTTGSFIKAWTAEARRIGLDVPTAALCCYPLARGFIEAHATLLRAALDKAEAPAALRVLFSAHGLPKRVVARGDPYQWQVEQTVAAIVEALGVPELDWQVCYQSRVGPLEWLGPSTEEEIHRAAREGKGLVVVPVAFVSEHSETLVELDMEYAGLAAELGVSPYIRVPALGTHDLFIQALRALALQAAAREGVLSAGDGRLCPAAFNNCPHHGR